ncbi:hypothetical protein CBR_g66705 [Chara braunii]|uniref:Reverse transcriptase domain-containing protein n=1 Tax=Chara braunii TaxID=69332 RepID=A0A388JQ35_CHABU|nr:hypothetical protein CBR_g66705 [Chara braunii]|eukprot:GBG59900.1 hypothetical protein CBR_g66705 [Chara braunii]
MSGDSSEEEGRLVQPLRITRRTALSQPITFQELAPGEERRLRREARERVAARRIRDATASLAAAMATAASTSQTSSQSSSSGAGQGGSGAVSQSADLQVTHQSPLTPEDLEIQQAEELQDELQRHMDEAAERRRKAILRKARQGSRVQELGRLEGLDEAALDPAVRVLRSALLSVAEAQNVQQELLTELVAGQKQILAELRAPRTMMRQPQFAVVPPAGAGPSSMPQPTRPTFSPMFGMPPPGGLVATSGPVHSVSAVPSTTVVTTVPLSRQAQVSVQQPVSVAMQPLQQAFGPMQPMQWMPKIPLMSPKPFSGDRKKDGDLDTWARTVPTYVRHKLTRPEQEVVAASFLEGSAARWLNGLVQQQAYGQNFDAWAQAQTLEEFVRSVYNRWHDPQGAQKASDAINSLCSRRFKNAREQTDTVERLLVVPGVRFDQQVLLTDYLRCLPAKVRTKLVDEAYVEQHTFATFSKKALDIEAKLGSAHQVSHDGRKRLPQDCKKKGQLMFVDHDGQKTEIDDFPDLGELTKQDGASETSDGGVVAPIKEKARWTGKKKVVRSTGQGDQGTPAWVKIGLDYVCFCEHFAGKLLGPVGVLAALTCTEVVTLPSRFQALAKARDPYIAPQTHSDPPTLCSRDVFEALEELDTKWSRKDPRDSWAMISRGPKGEHFVVEDDVGGRKYIGSTWNFISRAYVDRLRLGDQVQRLRRTVASTLANKQQMVVKDYVKDIVCTFSYGGGEVSHKISFLVSDKLPFDMLLGMYYLEVSQPQFDWDRKVLIHKLPNSRTVRLQKYKANSLVENYGCMCASSFYNYYKHNREEGMYLVFVSEKGEAVKTPPEMDSVVAQYSDLFEEPIGVVEREVVHAIEVVPGSRVPRGRIYRMSPAELDELRRQPKELTEKGWIRPSTSPYGAPVLFVPKKGGTLRMCIDYRGLNAITVKNAEPLPRIEYHQIAIRPEDQHNTAFQTRYGLYEFVVMPFGLCNAPGTSQHAMNMIFHDYLDKFIVVYLDDILIFSKTAEEHAEHLNTVLRLLRQHQYKINLEKCESGRTKILYLGHEISADGLRLEDAKVASIRDWPRSHTVTEVRSFLGMTGYYRPFVKNYSTVASPLTDLTRLDTPWEWTEECEASFKKLKYALTHYEVLKLPDPDKPFVVTTDANQYGIGAVLAQQDGPKLRPVEYMSKKMPSQILAKSTYERELYALYRALVHWRHYLLGRFFYVRSDHETLRYLTHSKDGFK